MATATRLIAISDLHLGGVASYMMSKPDRLATLIDSLPGRLAADEALALVIAGDFIDFLAIPGFESWTADPREACTKLEHTLRGPFAPIFDALRRYVAGGHRLTVLIGNHDLELALPAVQDALLRGIGAGSHQVAFTDDGSAYRVGAVLIEHGNRYDGANSNDWEGLRGIRSAQSRHEPPPRALAVSAGSVIVEKVVNAIKPRYPFIDLLQPQDRLLAYLLLAFEPSLLRRNLSRLGAILKGAWRQGENPLGVQPVRTREVAAETDRPLDPAVEHELRATFGADYEGLERPASTVASDDWLPIAGHFAQDGLAQLIKQDQAIPRKRLAQMRAVLRRWADNQIFDPDGATGPYGKAAERMIAAGAAELVIMGHTHLARHHGSADKASYINTGTWADLITVPQAALADSEAALDELADFLRGLFTDSGVRRFRPGYADVRIAADGHVERAGLEIDR